MDVPVNLQPTPRDLHKESEAIFLEDQLTANQSERAASQLLSADRPAARFCSQASPSPRISEGAIMSQAPQQQVSRAPHSTLSQQLRGAVSISAPQRSVAFQPSVETFPVQSDLSRPRAQQQFVSQWQARSATTGRCHRERRVTAQESSGEHEQQALGCTPLRKRKAASPLTSMEESGDAAGSTSSTGSEVSSVGAFQHRHSPGLVLQTRNLKVQCALPRSPASLSTCSSLRSSGSFLATLSEEGCQGPWTPRASLCAAMNGVVISPAPNCSPGPMQPVAMPWSTPRSASSPHPVATSPAEAIAVASFFGANPFFSGGQPGNIAPVIVPSPSICIPTAPSSNVPNAARSSASLKLRSLDSMLRRIALAEERAAAAKPQL